MKKKFFFFIIIVLFLASPLYAINKNKPQTLNDLIDFSWQNNPEIIELTARIEAASSRISQEQSLSDPMFTVGYQNEGFQRFTYGQLIGSQLMFSVAQKFPFPGVLEAQGQIANHEKRIIEISLRDLKLKLATKITNQYFDLFLASKTLDLVKENEILFNQIEKAALNRYSVGTSSQQDVLLAQLEKYGLEEQKIMLQQQKEVSLALLQATLGVTENIALDFSSVKDTSSYPSETSIDLNLAPSLQIINRMQAVQKSRVDLAYKSFIPDYTVMAGGFPRGGLDPMWNLSLSFPLPFFYGQKQGPAIQEAKSNLQALEKSYQAKELMIRAEAEEKLKMIAAADKLMALYKNGFVPKLQQTVALLISNYVEGKVDIITVLNNQKKLLDYEKSYWEQFVLKKKNIAVLKELLGRCSKASGGDLTFN